MDHAVYLAGRRQGVAAVESGNLSALRVALEALGPIPDLRLRAVVWGTLQGGAHALTGCEGGALAASGRGVGEAARICREAVEAAG